MNYDVVIVGGGTAGCAAAYTLGKAGKKVLVVEKSTCLGGSMTLGLVSPMMKSSDNQINTDFLNLFLNRMRENGAQITYGDGNKGWFNPEIAKIVLDEILKEVNVDVLCSSTVEKLDITNRNIEKLHLVCNMLSVCIGARHVVDATGNCDIGFLANCNFLENNSKEQPTNLRFIMSGINLNKFSDWLLNFDEDRNVTSSFEIDGQKHLSTAYTWDTSKCWALKPLFDDAVAKGVLKDLDRNYFQVFTIAGMPNSIGFNCPRIIKSGSNTSVLEPFEYSMLLQEGRNMIKRLSDFCKKYFVGFENSYISNIANMLGIRASRRIEGKYIYTIDDLKSGKKFDTPVVISNYPVDVHSTNKNESVLEHTYKEYQLPIEALMSKDIENLFVAGRCLSADFYAQGALRIIPSCFSMGEGVAKYILKNV